MLAQLWEHLKKDEMPIWLSLLLAFSAGAGTYVIAPLVNEEFEYQNNRTEHVSKTVDNFSDRFLDLSRSIRKFNDSLFYEQNDLGEKRSEALDKITELQWSLIDVKTILNREEVSDSSIVELQNSLQELGKSVTNARRPVDQEDVIRKMEGAAADSQEVLSSMYKAARLS